MIFFDHHSLTDNLKAWSDSLTWCVVSFIDAGICSDLWVIWTGFNWMLFEFCRRFQSFLAMFPIIPKHSPCGGKCSSFHSHGHGGQEDPGTKTTWLSLGKDRRRENVTSVKTLYTALWSVYITSITQHITEGLAQCTGLIHQLMICNVLFFFFFHVYCVALLT